MLAKEKGQNTIVWVIITIAAFFMAYIIGGLLAVLLFYRGPMEQAALEQFLSGEPLRVFFISVSGVGGYLLVRYILERMGNAQKGGDV